MNDVCRACERPANLHGRGLCCTCHRLHSRSGTLHWFPRLPHSDYVARIEDYRELAAQREHRESIANRLGVSLRSIERYAAATRGAA